MTKKDYILIAKVIKHHKQGVNSEQAKRMRESIAKELADELKNENNRFDYVKFLSACGIEE